MKTLFTLEIATKLLETIEKDTANHVYKPEIEVLKCKETTAIHARKGTELTVLTNRGAYWIGYPEWNEEYNGEKLYIGRATW